MTNQTLTAAERRTLGNILALGGDVHETQGTNRPGTVRKSVVAKLITRGLVTAEKIACGYRHRGTWYPATRYYATAAGCIAFGDEIARVS